MGSKNDDVIEDNDVAEVKIILVKLDPPLRVWTQEVLPLIGQQPTESEDTDETVTITQTVTTTPIEDVPKGPTPAELMLRKVNDPRPMDLTVPGGANGEETSGIDALHSQLVVHLQTHDGGDDLTVAEGMVVSIKDAVGKVPLRIKRELQERREKVAGTLGLLKLPEGLPENERLPLAENGTALAKSIGEATDIDTLDTLSLAVTTHGDNLRLAGEAVTLRTQTANALRLRIGKAVPPDQALTTEITRLNERGQALLSRLAPPLTDGGLKGVTTDTGVLEADVKTLTDTVTKRGETAEILRQRLLKITAAVGLPVVEATAFGSEVTTAGLDLKTPHSPDMLEKVEKRAGELEAAVQQQVVTVSDRAKRADALTLRLGLIKAPPRVTPEEAEGLRKSVETQTLLLPPPHAVLTLDGSKRRRANWRRRSRPWPPQSSSVMSVRRR